MAEMMETSDCKILPKLEVHFFEIIPDRFEGLLYGCGFRVRRGGDILRKIHNQNY